MPDIYTQVLRHCLWMATMEPAYAAKAARWYEQACQMKGMESDFKASVAAPAEAVSVTA